ncbi:LTA synthase family protein [Paenibacillus tarimensis]|uniref:LTA synthase family protein n=1 Tax=Paenibacillus tarimensis TaxID=416012 RepID=UPI001F1D8EF9|nr:LTA synthase family protein [Paenibacillus tarimensis]MCF2944267.1 LTA synthase family protein [Paenibacillus tarimensis]
MRTPWLSKVYTTLGTKPQLVFTLILLIKSYLAWFVIFEHSPGMAPLISEIPFIIALFCLIEYFASKRKMVIYLVVNLLLTGIFFAVIMYYKYYGVIVTYHALQQVNQVTAVKNSVFSLLDPYFLFIFTDILLFAYVFFRQRKAEAWKQLNRRSSRRGMLLSVFTLMVVICLMNILPNRASMNERVKAGEMGILNYEAYTIFSSDKVDPVDQSLITQEAINELKGIEPVAPEDAKYHGAAKGKNLIIIQMESFQNFLIDLKVEGQEVTPTMNKLAQEGFYFPHFYQQVGQGNTSDAEFVVNTSYYIPPRGAATMMYVDKALPSLPKLLKAEGYDTATFHTNVVEFWNRGELYSSLGFDRYYDAEFFGEEDVIFFGASDEVLYKKTAEELKRMHDAGQPFYSQVISMTAHHPFTIPYEKDQITLPERYQETFVGDYIRSQNYADRMLGKFIEDLKESGIWEDSLIVIYGDHLGLPIYSLDKEEKDLMAEIHGREYGYTDMINIPLMILGEGVTEPAVFDQLGGQSDLLPTIANLVGISLDDYIHFGQDILNHENNILPQRYYLPSGSLVSSHSLFMPGEGYEDGTQYSLSGDEESTGSVTKDEYNRALKLLHLSDSYVLQLPDKKPAE